jgi:hypothetical protein
MPLASQARAFSRVLPFGLGPNSLMNACELTTARLK